MSEYGNAGLKFADTAVRCLEERDIPALINLFKLNYGENFPYRQLYDPRWFKHAIYNEHIICIVIEEEGEILASGALILDIGDHNDQIGELGRAVVHPDRKNRGLGKRIISALSEVADETIELAVGEARISHPFMQILVEDANLKAVGAIIYLTHPYYVFIEELKRAC